MKQLRLLFIAAIAFSCTTKSPIEKALSSSSNKITTVLDNLEKHEVQILYSEVVRDKDGSISFKEDSFQVDENTYFYPASTVKFPIAILAMEKLGKNPKVDRNTPFQIDGDSVRTSVARDVEILFAVSDNLAYTRLFEYMGQDYINSELKKRGIDARISHRFSVPEPYSLESKSLIFYEGENEVFRSIPTKNDSIQSLTLEKVIKGVGFMSNDSLVNKPMDFSKKNYFPLSSQHQMMKQLMFPEAFSKEKHFQLSKEDRAFVLKAMSNLPKEVGYDPKEYYDSYVKFLIFGDSKENMPEHITIFNKVGYAYGYLTDCAYILNTKTNKEYIITATIHVNENQIFNDNKYEYESIGIPFLAELGRQLVE